MTQTKTIAFELVELCDPDTGEVWYSCKHEEGTVLPKPKNPTITRSVFDVRVNGVYRCKGYADDDGDLLFNIHEVEGGCEGAHCMIHNPSDHIMRGWPLVWREVDLTEPIRGFCRICPHDVLHPDPDGVEYRRDNGYEPTVPNHVCDGCCTGTYD